MTHIQKVFIQNLRFFRNKKKLSQLELSELANITPNYLNAVENGKNFPSPDVLQRIIEVLDILPYQLFLEFPGEAKTTKQGEKNILFKELTQLKQQFNHEIDMALQKYTQQEKKQ